MLPKMKKNQFNGLSNKTIHLNVKHYALWNIVHWGYIHKKTKKQKKTKKTKPNIKQPKNNQKQTNKQKYTNFPYKSIYHCIKPFLACIRSFLCFHLHIRNLHILTVKLCKILLLSAILKNNLKNEGKNIFYLGIDTCSCPSLNTIIICNESERSILVWYSWPLGFVCLISRSGNA